MSVTTSDQVLKTGVGAVAGAILFAAAAPVVLPVLGLGAIGAAVAGTTVIGTGVGAIAGWKWGQPTEEQLNKAIAQHRR